MSRPLRSTARLAALAACLGAAARADDAAGCCYSVGYGASGEPCCLETSGGGRESCRVGTRLGGATGFSPHGCPASARQAAGLIDGTPASAQRDAEASFELRGCCFSFGFGNGATPCCLESRLVEHEGACQREQRLGGATGYREGSCPSTAEEAAQLMRRDEERERAAVAAAHDQLCCFQIGFGAEMEPCCLETRMAAHAQDCAASPGSPVGGSAGSRQGACPKSAAEAQRWIADSKPRSAKPRQPPSADTTGAVAEGEGPAVLPSTLVFAAGVLAASCAAAAVVIGRQRPDAARGYANMSDGERDQN